MDINTPSLFIDSTSLNYLTQPEVEYVKGSRIISYDYTLPDRITKCPYSYTQEKRNNTKACITLYRPYKLRVHYYQYRCPICHGITLDSIPFRCGRSSYTSYFKSQILRLLEDYGTTMKRCASLMRATHRQVKEIKKQTLMLLAGDLKPTHYSKHIAIDEFLLEHPHRYCTIVIDADTGELQYLEKGKSKRK